MNAQESDQPSGTGSPDGPPRRRPSGRFLLELGIIFAGVFGAFIAEDVRQQREDDQRARQTYEALLGEIRAFAERAPFVVDQMASTVDAWSVRHEAGETPPPPFYREPRAEAPPTAIWEATLASGGVALLKPELFNELAVFYNRVVSVSDRYRRYNTFTEQELLPYLDAEATHFFEADGRLRGSYRAHVQFLAEVRDEIDQLSDEAANVEASVLAELGR
jgi:hypothetical protein